MARIFNYLNPNHLHFIIIIIIYHYVHHHYEYHLIKVHHRNHLFIVQKVLIIFIDCYRSYHRPFFYRLVIYILFQLFKK